MRTDRRTTFFGALNRRPQNLLVAAAFLWAAAAAQAGTGSNCDLVLCVTIDAGDLAFGNYAPLGGSVTDGTSTIAVSARLILGLVPTAISYTLSLGSGGGTIAQRTMSAGANTLHYNLFTTSARTTVWGTNSVSGSTNALTGNASHTVYGRVPANQTTTVPGSYGDSMLVTITF